MRQLVSLAAPYRTALIAVAALTILSSTVLLAIPWLAGEMIGKCSAITVTEP